MPPVIAIVLAAGSGRRAGQTRPKQLCPIGGHPMLAYSLAAFERHPLIGQTAVVTTPALADEVRAMTRRYGWRKLQCILPGGRERSDSSRAAVEAFRAQPDSLLLLHDAARPLVDAAAISRLCQALATAPAAALALPSVDTLWQLDAEGRIVSVPDRSRLWRAQTPQGFRSSLLARAYERAAADPAFSATDDCGVVLRYCPETDIRPVEGSEQMFKVTYAPDFERAERFVAAHPELMP